RDPARARRRRLSSRSVLAVGLELPRLAGAHPQPGHARHAVEAIARAQLPGRTDHDLAHRADHLVRAEDVAGALPVPVEAPVLDRHLVEALVVELETAPRRPAGLLALDRVAHRANPSRATAAR